MKCNGHAVLFASSRGRYQAVFTMCHVCSSFRFPSRKNCLHSATSQITEEKVAVTKPLILHDYSAHNQTNAFQQWQIWPECWTCLGIKLFTIGYLFIWILFFRKCSFNCLSCNRHTSLNGNRKSRRPENIRAKAQLRPVIKHGPFHTSHKQSRASQPG